MGSPGLTGAGNSLSVAVPGDVQHFIQKDRSQAWGSSTVGQGSRPDCQLLAVYCERSEEVSESMFLNLECKNNNGTYLIGCRLHSSAVVCQGWDHVVWCGDGLPGTQTRADTD